MQRVLLHWSKTKVRKVLRRVLWVALGAAFAVLIIGGIDVVKHQNTPLGYNYSEKSAVWLPSTVTRYHSEIDTMARRYDIDSQLAYIIMTLESGGDKRADSGQANGLMQITPYTAKDIAFKHLMKRVQKYDLSNPKTNIEFGVAYLAYLRSSFCDQNDGPTWNSCVEVIAAGYNGGPGAAVNLIEGRGLSDTQTVIYSRNALNMWRERHASTSPTYTRWLEAGGQRLIDGASK